MIENWAKVGNAVTGLKAPWPEVISPLKTVACWVSVGLLGVCEVLFCVGRSS